MANTMRADPQNRLPHRGRRSFGIWRDTKAAWTLTSRACLRRPVLFGAALVLWAVIRFACLRALAQPHPALLLPEAATLLVLALIADAGPVGLAALLWPAQHRIILDAARPGAMPGAARAARMFGAALVLALCGVAALAFLLTLPLYALPALGRVSTILAQLLLLPAVCLALTWLLRLSFGLPAISLGLPRALAEGWTISRFGVPRALCVWLLAYTPIILALAAWQLARPARLGWAETLVRPLLDVLAVSLTGSLTGLFYREMRLPRDLRPDVRPSWNRSFRREPIIT